MININNIIVNQCKIYVRNRNDILTRSHILRRFEGRLILNFGNQDSGKLLFEDVVDSLLQICINCKVYIITCDRIYGLGVLDYLTKVINIYCLASLYTLKIGFKSSLNTRLTDHVRKYIIRPYLIRFA